MPESVPNFRMSWPKDCALLQLSTKVHYTDYSAICWRHTCILYFIKVHFSSDRDMERPFDQLEPTRNSYERAYRGAHKLSTHDDVCCTSNFLQVCRYFQYTSYLYLYTRTSLSLLLCLLRCVRLAMQWTHVVHWEHNCGESKVHLMQCKPSIMISVQKRHSNTCIQLGFSRGHRRAVEAFAVCTSSWVTVYTLCVYSTGKQVIVTFLSMDN